MVEPSNIAAARRNRGRNVEVGEVEVPDDPFEGLVMHELRDRPQDGIDHFCISVAYLLRELGEQTRQRTMIRILTLVYEARFEDSQ